MCRKRYKKEKDGSHPCFNKFDLEFKKWILFGSRKNSYRKTIEYYMNQTHGQKLIFKNNKQLTKWVESKIS